MELRKRLLAATLTGLLALGLVACETDAGEDAGADDGGEEESDEG